MQIYLLWVILDAWLRPSSCAERVPALVGCARTEAFSHILKAAREWLAPGETPQGGGETAWPQASRRARARPHRTRGGPAAEREIRAGRPGDAWALLPGLPFSAALGVVSRLDAVGWSPPDPAGTVLRRVRPAARLPAGSLDAILSGVPSLLGAIPGSPPVSALSFAPDAPALAVTGYEHGLEVWSVRRSACFAATAALMQRRARLAQPRRRSCARDIPQRSASSKLHSSREAGC